MPKIALIVICILNILRISALPTDPQKTFTIREKYDQIVDVYLKENLTISSGFRMQDKDCLEELLKLKTPESEVTKKFWKKDIEMILEGASAHCNEETVDNMLESIMMRVNPFELKYIDPDINCLKNALFKLEPTSPIVDGFTPSQEYDNSEVCKEKVLDVTDTSDMPSEYPQCVKPLYSSIKIIKLKMEILFGDDITDEKRDAEALKIAEYGKSMVMLVFKCIMETVHN